MGTQKNRLNERYSIVRRLISAFVIRFFESIIWNLLQVKVSVAVETGLKLALSETPKTGFVASRLTVILLLFVHFFALVLRDGAYVFHSFSFRLRREKTCHREFTNNKGADQPAYPRRPISAFVIRFMESIISGRATSEISIF